MPTTLEQPAPTFQDVWRMFQETSLQIKETDRQMKETDRKIKQLSTEIGNLGNRLGDFVQGIVKPGLEELFQQRGLTVHRTMQNLEKRDDAGQMLSEVDLLVIDSVVAVAVECKSNLSLDDVKDHLNRLASFKEHWPEYAHYHLLGAVATMVLPEDVGHYAYRKGLYVLAQKGEQVEIRNDARFRAKEW